MSYPVLYLAITSHGFGHAVRIASVAALVKKLRPETLLIVTTTAPRWLLESYIQADFIYRPRSFDVGVIQADSLNMNKEKTLAKIKELQQKANSLIASEATYLKQNRVGLVLADIPPLAATIAATAGVDCWMMSNFGWDFIYRAWGGEFVEIAEGISSAYSNCHRLFRLPFAESMDAFPQITDVGLTGGTPKYSISELRSEFQLKAPPERTVLLTFGGLGWQNIPYPALEAFSDWQFITFDRLAPDLPNLVKITDFQYRPVDFMPLVGRVVSKPGYSTFAEALRLDVPLVSLTREDFAEASLLLEGLQDYGFHQIITPENLIESNWEFLCQPLRSPRLTTPLDKNGTESIAERIIDYLF